MDTEHDSETESESFNPVRNKHLNGINSHCFKPQSDTWNSTGKMLQTGFLKSIISNPNSSMWVSSHEANDPSEDRSASLVNVFLRPPDDMRNVNNDDSSNPANVPSALLRLSLWSVFDGHGGGLVATYASKLLLPHIAQSISNVLKCEIASKGEFTINGKRENRDWLDTVKWFETEKQKMKWRNPQDYRRFGRRNYFGGDKEMVGTVRRLHPNAIHYTAPESNDFSDEDSFDSYESDDNDSNNEENEISGSDSEEECGDAPQATPPIIAEGLDKSADTKENPENFKSINDDTYKVGTHSPDEASLVTDAISKSFLAIDEGWINSIDSSRIQTSCEGGGLWNVGACALVVGLIQRIETSNEINDRSTSKPVDGSDKLEHEKEESPDEQEKVVENNEKANIKSYDAMLYMAHCGDCRSVLGTTVDPNNNSDDELQSTSDKGDSADDSSESSFDESIDSSNSSDLDNSDEEENGAFSSDNSTYSYMTYSRHLAKRKCLGHTPFQRPMHNSMLMQRNSERKNDRQNFPGRNSNVNSPSSPPLPPNMISIDLTVDHSAYNPVESWLVKKRSRAPRAISPASCGGIQRVAGSLAVTRALGDAYLKTPELSFHPYKRYAPYISALPEVSRRILLKDDESGILCDRILVLASDGVWERASGKNVIEWIRMFFHENHQHDCSSSKSIHQSQNDRRVDLRSNCSIKLKRKRSSSKKRKCTVADFVVRRVLNKVRHARRLTSLRALMTLPKGRSRRSKHDDITTSIVDLSAFVS